MSAQSLHHSTSSWSSCQPKNLQYVFMMRQCWEDLTVKDLGGLQGCWTSQLAWETYPTNYLLLVNKETPWITQKNLTAGTSYNASSKSFSNRMHFYWAKSLCCKTSKKLFWCLQHQVSNSAWIGSTTTNKLLTFPRTVFSLNDSIHIAAADLRLEGNNRKFFRGHKILPYLVLRWL